MMLSFHRLINIGFVLIVLLSSINLQTFSVKAGCVLQGSIYIDVNLNGMRDADESGVPEVMVTAYDGSRPVANVLGSTQTDQNGHYVLDLSQIEDMVIRIEVTDLPDALISAPSKGSVDYDAPRINSQVVFGSCDSDIVFDGMNLVMFTQEAYCDLFCEEVGIELGNRVWYDLDGNGRQDPDESPVQGAVVSLYIQFDTSESLIASVTTDSLGQYYFNSRTIDAYRAEEGRRLDIPDITFLDVNENRAYDAGEPRGIMPNRRYRITVGDPDNFLSETDPLWQYYVTVPQANPDNIDNSYLRDSDGIVPSPENPVSSVNDASVIITTGDFGIVDHSYDFGFALEAQDIPPTATPTASDTPTPTATSTATATPTATATLTATATPTLTATHTPTLTVTQTSTAEPTPTAEPSTAEPDDD